MADPTLSSLERWNTRYSADGYLFGEAPNRFLAERTCHFSPGQRILCPADGEGRNSVWLAQQGMEVDAFDVSDIGVEKARSLACRAGVNVNYQICGVDEWNWKVDTYDGVAAIFLQFAPPTQRATLFRHFTDTLKTGGHLLLLGYSPKQLDYRTGGPSDIDHLYTEDLLREAFSASMNIIELTAFEDVLNEGAGHAGRSALIGLVAVKR